MTTFTLPLKTVGANGITGDTRTDTIGYQSSFKQVSIGAGNSRGIIQIPAKSTLLRIGAIPTSALAGDTASSAMNVNFGSSADSVRYGTVLVSANTRMSSSIAASAATDFDTGGAMVITMSAQATTTFTAGGVRAFVEYVTVE